MEQSKFTKIFSLSGNFLSRSLGKLLSSQPHLSIDMRRTSGTLPGRRCAPFPDAPFPLPSLPVFSPTLFLSFEGPCSKSCTSLVHGDTTRTLCLSRLSMMVSVFSSDFRRGAKLKLPLTVHSDQDHDQELPEADRYSRHTSDSLSSSRCIRFYRWLRFPYWT